MQECVFFFVSLCVKKRTKKRTPTTCKYSTKNGLKQVLGQVSRLIRAKCKDWQVKLEGMYQTESGLVVTASPRGHTAPCPCCGRRSHSVHSYRPRKLQDLEFFGKEVTLLVNTRHFRCCNPECERKIFAEPLKMTAPYMRTTHDVHERIRHEALNQPAASAVRTLSYQHIRTSASTCHRLVRHIGIYNPQVRTSGYVGIDDFAKKKGRVYACTIVDHYTRDTLAVFDSRYGEEIGEWLAEHKEIKLVTRDGSRKHSINYRYYNCMIKLQRLSLYVGVDSRCNLLYLYALVVLYLVTQFCHNCFRMQCLPFVWEQFYEFFVRFLGHVWHL